MKIIDIQGKQSLGQLLSDYKQLEKNSFFELLLQSFKEDRENYLNQLGTGINLSESELRAFQGAIGYMGMISKRPEDMVKLIQAKLKGDNR